MKKNNHKCWVCSSLDTKKIRDSSIKNTLDSKDFKITNKDYGKTLSLFKCNNCGFLFSPYVSDLENYYREMEDNDYELTLESRKIQSEKILSQLEVRNIFKNKTLLDVGSGSGALMQASQKFGLISKGIEPSKSLQKLAVKKNLDVILGTLPSKRLNEKFDFVTLIDVIEHVNDPESLLKEINTVLKLNGKLFLVTPDVNSFFSKFLKFKWWHFRVAHVGYFNQKTLNILIEKCGYEIIKYQRPNWYFPISYILNRILSYISPKIEIKLPKSVDITIPLNLFDSYLVECKKINENN